MACDDKGDIMGVCRLQMNSASIAQLRFMAVTENKQGTGIGKKLISYAEEKARQKGATTVILQSREIALEFYKKCGYGIKEKSFLMWNEIQHYLMEKKL
jgi:N-acetylglutamate synthase-like GNAT family acetyltransferase